jgi:predicted porin
MSTLMAIGELRHLVVGILIKIFEDRFMKKTLLALAVLGTLAGTASAQTSVTMYGSIDLSIDYTTHQDAKGDHVFSMGDSGAIGDQGQGAIGGSRLGFKGEEDLGGGNKALFLMEAGFTGNNGQSDQQGQLFGRQEYVGLSSAELGKLTLGRQYGVATDFAFDFDPMGVGNTLANEWEIFLYGVRFDNTLMYNKSFGPVTLNVQYSIGGQAGSTSEGSTIGFNVKYNQGSLGLGGVYQQMTDAGDNKSSTGEVGVTYNYGPGMLYGDYVNVQTDAGFGKAASLSGLPLANTSMFVNTVGEPSRKDSVWVVGASYNFTPVTTLTVGYMHDAISQDVVGDGTMASVYGLLEYHLSKRSEVYLSLTDAKVTGQAETTGFNGVGAGQTNSMQIAVGTRVKF